MVSTGALSAAARLIDLGSFLRLGRGVEKAGGRQLDSLLANAMEALFGAVYLDSGLAAAAAAFQRLAVSNPAEANFKGRLQEMTQGEGAGAPRYELASTSGPGHRRQYSVEVWLAELRLGEGRGPTRRAAEQQAARQALSTRYGVELS